MSIVESYYRSARRRLNALQDDATEETWKLAYVDAERCHFFELALSSLLDVLKFIQEIDRSWRAAVYRGIEQPNDHNDKMRECFENWADLARKMREGIPQFHKLGCRIERGPELDDAIVEANRKLEKWISPCVAQSPLMRVDDVSEEEADALRNLLQAPSGSPGKLTMRPLEIPEGNASFFDKQ